MAVLIIVLAGIGFLGIAVLLRWCSSPASRKAMADYYAAERAIDARSAE